VDITKREGYGMDKGEMIEGALGWLEQIFRDPENQPPQWDSIATALAESKDVIVIEAEVEHIKDTSGWQTLVNGDFVSVPGISRPIPMFTWQSPGKLGTPGPYVLFGVPKPRENRKP